MDGSDEAAAVEVGPVERRPIGYVRSDIASVADLAPQASDAAEAVGRVVVEPEYVDGLLGLESYRHLWLLTWLHRQPDGPAPLRLVPRATEATGELQGVFASRAPHRPNPIGMSLVRLIELRGNEIVFAGVDVLDGTPVLDVKPWFADCDLP